MAQFKMTPWGIEVATGSGIREDPAGALEAGAPTSQVKNGEADVLRKGEVVRISATDTVVRAQADTTGHLVGIIGVAADSALPGQVVEIATLGDMDVMLVTGLTVAAGQTLYVSAATAGRATNVAPANVAVVGMVKNATAYTDTAIVKAVASFGLVTTAAAGVGAPADASYWTSGANSALTAEANIGALADGLIKHASGVPGQAVAGTDYTVSVSAHGDGSISVAGAAGARVVQVGALATDAQHGVRGGGTQHAAATTGVSGFMSAADKVKVDAIGGDTTVTSLTAPIITQTRGTLAPSSGTISGYTQTATFAPASGTAVFRGLDVGYTVNQTGGANGTVTGVLVNATETAVVGSHRLLDLQVASTSKVTVVGSGATTLARGTEATTAGTLRHVNLTSTFAPTSGTSVYRPLEIAYTINQTGGASGTTTGLYVSATETAVVGTHNLLDLLIGSSSRFKVSGVGDVTLVGDINMTGGKKVIVRSNNYVASNTTSQLNFIAGNNELLTLDGTNFLVTVAFSRFNLSGSTLTNTSGAIGCSAMNFSFAPTSGTAVFRALDIGYTINQTGGANGAVTGINLNAAETAVGGTHNLIDLQVGGVSKFKVSGGATSLTTVGGDFLISSGVLLHTRGTVTSTSGTQYGLQTTSTFAPPSGTAAYRAGWINYAINQTGGANGAVTGLLIASVETAVVGTHNLIDLQVGGVSKFKVGGTAAGAGVTGISFFGATPAAQGIRGATLTNSVTAGGTDDTIANFTDLVVYATDAAAIRNDIYQLARALRQHDVALRAYGLLT